MKIERNWLKQHDACPEGIARFVEWAGDEPRSLEEIADHHPDAKDLAWLLDLVAPFKSRREIVCRIAGEAAAIFSRQPEGDRHWWFARNINPGNIKEAAENARANKAPDALVDLYHDASNGNVVNGLCAFEDFIDGLEQTDARVVHDNLRNALRLMHRAQTCLVERAMWPAERSAAAERVGKAYQMMNGDIIWIRYQTDDGMYEALRQCIIVAEWGEEHGWMPCEYLMHPDQFVGAVPATAPQFGETVTIYRPLLGSTVNRIVSE
jgi:hypothetical protein